MLLPLHEKDRHMTNQQIIETLASLEARLVKLEARIATAPAAKSSAGRVATVEEMDSPRGNPEVRSSPKKWDGVPCKGRRFSDCPPDFLDQLASLCDWMADRDDEAGARGETDAKGYKLDGKWKRLDAALARGWAKRLREGWGAGQRGLGGIL